MPAALHAQFGGGPLDGNPHALCIADSPWVLWPPQFEWTARYVDKRTEHYVYIHTGGGHYQIARRTTLEAAE